MTKGKLIESTKHCNTRKYRKFTSPAEEGTIKETIEELEVALCREVSNLRGLPGTKPNGKSKKPLLMIIVDRTNPVTIMLVLQHIGGKEGWGMGLERQMEGFRRHFDCGH